MTRDDLFALKCSADFGYLRPTDAADVAQLDRLAEQGVMERGSGPVKGDTRCGRYWKINDAGLAMINAALKGTSDE